MKKNILLLLVATFLFSCSSNDDDNPIVSNDENTIRISQVNVIADEIVLTNLGSAAVDIADYWLCLGPGTYVKIGDIATGSTSLSLNQTITLSYDVNPVSGGLSVFSTNTFASSDPQILLDYVQWGAANQARADQAVTAGRWDNVSNFVQTGSMYTFTGNLSSIGASFWNATAASSIVRILEVNTTTDEIVLSNFGNASIDVGSYWLCLGPGTYVQVSNAASGSTTLAPGQNVTLSYDVNPTSGGLSIFYTNSFSSSDASILLDYVQWGAANQARVGQAVTAGRWDNASNFVQTGSPYNFSGDANSVGVTFWN